MKNLNKKSKKAFTLVEVMLSVGVIVVSLTALLALLGAITSSVSQVRRQSKAMTVIEHVSTILKMTDFDTFYTKVSDPSKSYLMYFWDEYENPNDVESSSLILRSSEDNDRTQSQAPSSSEVRENVVGDVYRVLITLNGDMLVNKYIDGTSSETYSAGAVLPAEASSYIEAALPLRVEILADPKRDILDESASSQENDLRRVMEETIMKMR